MVYILLYIEYHTVVVLCQFFVVLAGNSSWTYVLTIQLWCCVSFFWFWREVVFGVTFIISVQYSCAVMFLENDYPFSLF